jgi:hypothetical protein
MSDLSIGVTILLVVMGGAYGIALWQENKGRGGKHR